MNLGLTPRDAFAIVLLGAGVYLFGKITALIIAVVYGKKK